MITGSPLSPGGLRLTEQSSVQGVISDTLTWGRKWLQALASQEGVINAWIGLTDENRSINWVTSLSPTPIPAQFSQETLQDVQTARKTFTFVDHAELISGGLFPLRRNENVFGMIGLLSGKTDYFNSETIKWMHILSNIIADSIVIQNGGGGKELEYSISRVLQSCTSLQEALPGVLRSVAELLEADAITVLHYNALLPSRFELLMTQGLKSAALAKLNFHFDVGLVGKSFENRVIWIDDLMSPSSDLQPINPLQEEGFRGYLAVPLVVRNNLIGAMEIVWKSPKYTATWDLSLLERVAEQIAFAVERAHTLKSYRENISEVTARYNAMIEGLSRALELRDLETEGHTRRVSQLTMQLVEHMRIPVEQWDTIRQGALLHDIGKIGIPDAILLKPGSLTGREKKVMQQHVVYGYKILAPITNARHALDITLYHHEHWDGTGYPYGLKGEQIPLVARLFSIIDVFDALTSDRPYRMAWSRLRALDYIKEQSERWFDPQIVRLFMEVAGGGN